MSDYNCSICQKYAYHDNILNSFEIMCLFSDFDLFLNIIRHQKDTVIRSHVQTNSHNRYFKIIEFCVSTWRQIQQIYVQLCFSIMFVLARHYQFDFHSWRWNIFVAFEFKIVKWSWNHQLRDEFYRMIRQQRSNIIIDLICLIAISRYVLFDEIETINFNDFFSSYNEISRDDDCFAIQSIDTFRLNHSFIYREIDFEIDDFAQSFTIRFVFESLNSIFVVQHVSIIDRLFATFLIIYTRSLIVRRISLNIWKHSKLSTSRSNVVFVWRDIHDRIHRHVSRKTFNESIAMSDTYDKKRIFCDHENISHFFSFVDMFRKTMNLFLKKKFKLILHRFRRTCDDKLKLRFHHKRKSQFSHDW